MLKARIDLSDVAETLLITLYFRAVESQRPDALVKDECAIELMSRIDYDFHRFRRQLFDLVPTILRVRQFDRYTQAFLAEHPDGRVVQIGCGLDTRFDRVDNGRVEWYDLDLPNVIALPAAPSRNVPLSLHRMLRAGFRLDGFSREQR